MNECTHSQNNPPEAGSMLSVFGHREYESKLGKLPKVTKLEIANSSWNPDNLGPEPVLLTNMNSAQLPPQKNTDV